MISFSILRFVATPVFLAATLVACQGDDNTLPLPPDAGSSDARSDATSHDGAVNDGSSTDASSDAKDASDAQLPEADATDDTGDVSVAPDAGDVTEGGGD